MKKIQNVLLVMFLLNFAVCMPSESKGKRWVRFDVGPSHLVESEGLDQYYQFFDLINTVKKALPVIEAQSEIEREFAKKALIEYMAKENLNSLVKKVIQKDIEAIQNSTDKAAMNKAYQHLCDMVLAVDAQLQTIISRKGSEIDKKPMELKKPLFDLTVMVQQAEGIIKTENDEARKNAKLKLGGLLNDKRLHPSVKKVISEDIAIILDSGDMQERNKAYDRLRDIVEFMQSLRFVSSVGGGPDLLNRMAGKIAEIMPQVGKMYFWKKLNHLQFLIRDTDDIIKIEDSKKRKVAQDKFKKDWNYWINQKNEGYKGQGFDDTLRKVIKDYITTVAIATDKPTLIKARNYLADLFAAMNSQKEAFEKLGPKFFDLKKIAEKAKFIVTAKDSTVREAAKKDFTALMKGKDIDPNVKKLLQDDINVFQKSNDTDELNGAYNHLSDIISVLDMSKPDRYESMGYGEYAYRKLKGVVKTVLPESVQNILDKPVDYISRGIALPKDEAYKSILLGLAISTAHSGIRAMFNKYKIFTGWSDLEKNLKKAVSLRDKILERSVQVYKEGHIPRQDKTIKDLNAELKKSNKEFDTVMTMLWKAGVPVAILDAFSDKVDAVLYPHYEEYRQEPEAPAAK